MGILDKILKRGDKKEELEEAPMPTEEVGEAVEDLDEAPEIEDNGVNREPVPYIPAPKPNQVFNSDSNEKDPKTPSFL